MSHTDSRMSKGFEPPERFLNYFIDPRLIGCTNFHRAFDLSACPPQPVFCRVVSQAEHSTFLAGEGLVHATLANTEQHPNLPRVLATAGHAVAGGVLAFQPCFGNLHTLVRQVGAVPEAQAAGLVRQMVSAVAHCHAHRICLRDIKLGKIMFADRAMTRVVLADLAGAQVVAPGQLLTDKRGSPAYVAPEVLCADAYDGFAADIWSLGVVAYVLLTGGYPFSDTDPAALFALITAGDITLPATLSPAARGLLLRMLDRNPALRPSAAELLASDSFLAAGGAAHGGGDDDAAAPGGAARPRQPDASTVAAAAAAIAASSPVLLKHAMVATTCACPVCSKPFASAAMLRKHMQAHGRRPDKPA